MWVFMEFMNRSLDKLIELVYKKLQSTIPDQALLRIAYSVVSALHYLKENVKVLHRDVKPSNILISDDGDIKLCDFGISGILQGSYCSTTVGCARYLAPERIDIAPNQPPPKYDSRSDTWSLGLTMFELAVGKSPYPEFETPFQRITCIVDGEAPRIEDTDLSENCKEFIHYCLVKDVEERPRYTELLKHPFLEGIEDDFDMAVWYQGMLKQESMNT
jgi:serine/threonine protein kinase